MHREVNPSTPQYKCSGAFAQYFGESFDRELLTGSVELLGVDPERHFFSLCRGSEPDAAEGVKVLDVS